MTDSSQHPAPDTNEPGRASPLRLLIIITLTIFFGETVIMFFLSHQPVSSRAATAFLDSFILSLITFPILYLLLFRPGTGSVAEREQMAVLLEETVRQLTSELNDSNETLRQEITRQRNAGKNLLQKNSFLSLVIDSLPHPFYVVDAKDYSIVMANHAVAPADKWRGKTCHKLTHGKDTPCSGTNVACPLLEVIRTKKHTSIEHVHVTSDGEKQYVEVHGYPVFDMHGNVAQMIEYSMDITARKQAEQALRDNERFISHIFDSIQDGISVLDRDLNILRVNRTMEKWHCHSLPLEGKKCYEVYHGRDIPCRVCPSIRALEGGNLEMDEVPLATPEGESRTRELFAFPMINGHDEVTGVVEYVRDISRRKKVEQEKERLIEELQMAVDEIKVLSGILPICMYCKQIRDDSGYWNQVENYVSAHSEARFSHSICPKCMDEHYPEELIGEEEAE